MRHPSSAIACACLAMAAFLGLLGPAASWAKDRDEELLDKAGIKTDAASLIALLKDWSANDADLEAMDALIKQMGANKFKDRDAAEKKLIALGPAAIEPLRRALDHKDIAIATGAKKCLRAISDNPRPFLALAAIRLLIRQEKPAAIPPLLQYLPYAADFDTQDEIWYGLYALARKEPELDDSVKSALTDKLSARRAAAGFLHGRLGDEVTRKEARKLLEDKDAEVRLRTAQGLLAASDPAGIPVLIDLLDAKPTALAWQAEELLCYVAGDEAPEPTVGAGTDVERKRCREAWERWWKKHGPNLDLGEVARGTRRPGLVLVTLAGGQNVPREEGSRIVLLGCDGRRRWQLQREPWPGPRPVPFELLPRDRLLTVEYGEDRIAELDLTGKARWLAPVMQKGNKTGGDFSPLLARRLANGNTWIAASNRNDDTRLGELHPDGSWVFDKLVLREDFRMMFPRTPCIYADNGSLCCLQWGETTYAWKITSYDPAETKVLASVSLKEKLAGSPGITALGKGHFLVAAEQHGDILEVREKGLSVDESEKLRRDKARSGKLIEFDTRGQMVRSWPLVGATSAATLRNGNLLGAGKQTIVGAGWRIVEMDREGKVLWEALQPYDLKSIAVYQARSVQPCFELVRLGFDQPRPANFDINTSVPYRVKQFKSAEPGARYRAAWDLKELAGKARDAVPALLEGLDDNEPRVRELSDEALREMVGPESLLLIVDAAKDRRPHVRAVATHLLCTFKNEGRYVVPTLLKAMKDEDLSVRLKATAAIGHFPKDPGVVGALITALQNKDKDLELAKYACGSLARCGRHATGSVPLLMETAKGADDDLARQAISTLGSIGADDPEKSEEIVRFLVQVLEDNKRVNITRGRAARSLGRMGKAAKDAIPALERAIKEGLANIASDAEIALKQVQP